MGRKGARNRVESVRTRGAEHVDGRLPTPLYHQVYLVLRDKILSTDYEVDTILPSEQETARRFGVSRITARRALDELATSGLVIRQRGRGTRVTYRPPSPPVRAGVEGLLENLLAMGLKTEVSVLEYDYVDASEGTARALQCEIGQRVQRAVRVRHLEGKPFSHLTTFVPEEIGRSYSREDLASKPLLTLLERCGVVVSGAEQTISATLADTNVAPILGVEVGSPLLKIDRIVCDQEDSPVEYITGLYRPDLYNYRMTLSRVQNDGAKAWSPTG